MTHTRVRCTLYSLLLVSLAVPGAGQGPGQNQPDCSAPSTPVTVAPLIKLEERPVSAKLLVPNILQDQKRIWLFPVGLARGEHLKPALGFALGTAGLVALDPHDTPYFRRTTTFNDFNRVMSSRNTGLSMWLFPPVFYALGMARKDQHAKDTALLGVQALANAQLLTLALKSVNRRVRPRELPPDGDFTHTWFKAGGRVISYQSSFPSGHSMMAFSLATVFTYRYRRHRWVPWVAYALASAVAFSRVTTRSHYPSDIFAGAVLGYAMTRYIVLRPPSQ